MKMDAKWSCVTHQNIKIWLNLMSSKLSDFAKNGSSNLYEDARWKIIGLMIIIIKDL